MSQHDLDMFEEKARKISNPKVRWQILLSLAKTKSVSRYLPTLSFERIKGCIESEQ
jgi:hypothetical protein